jgi:hypothetical protein
LRGRPTTPRSRCGRWCSRAVNDGARLGGRRWSITLRCPSCV